MTTNVLNLEQCKRAVEFVGWEVCTFNDSPVAVFIVEPENDQEYLIKDYIHSDDFLPVLLRALVDKGFMPSLESNTDTKQYWWRIRKPGVNHSGRASIDIHNALLLCVDEALEKGVLK